MSGHSAPALVLSASQRRRLMEFARGRAAARSVARRAKILLGVSTGISNRQLATKLGTTDETIRLWKRRFEEKGVRGILKDLPRPGRPRQISAAKEVAIVEATRNTTQKTGASWTVRTLARREKVSPAAIHRIWKAYDLKPRQTASSRVRR